MNHVWCSQFVSQSVQHIGAFEHGILIPAHELCGLTGQCAEQIGNLQTARVLA